MTVVGIDLGTTNTVVACVLDGRVHVLADDKGNRLLPSVVSFHPNGDVLVGPAARERRLVDAKNTIASIKRLIGRPWDSDEIRLARSRFPFELREGPGQGALVIARGEAYTLPEISAFVLKRARQIAEAALGETVDKAVITVPAHFNELQRASTKVAGRVAGLEVLRILNEPTAAALAYGFGGERSERVAVYDFGGGTFDCSLLDLTGSLFEVLATAGDTFLGGDDIDTAIAEVMCNAFLAQHRYDPRVDPQAFERLRAAAEALKKDLSVNPQAQIDLPEVAYGVGGKRLGFTFGLTQADLDVLATPFVDRTLQVTQDSLNIARLSPSSFDHVILVGGSTRMPLVARRVEAFFGVPVIDRVNPDEVVAIGAAVQAAALSDATRKRSIPEPPQPGVIGPPQQMPHDDPPSLSQESVITSPGFVSRAGVGMRAPPVQVAPAVKTLRPGVAATVPTPFAPSASRRGGAREQGLAAEALPAGAGMTTAGDADTEEHSIATGHTMPAGHAGTPPSTAVTPDNFTISTRADTSLRYDPTAARPAPRGPAIPPKPVVDFGAMRPLETDDISRIVPDAFPFPPPLAPAAPSPASAPGTRPLAQRGLNVAPLETEDISMIAPEHMNPAAHGVGPLPTEDLSLIAPERANPAARPAAGVRPAAGARPAAGLSPRAAPPPFVFPPVPPAQQASPRPPDPPAAFEPFDLPSAPVAPPAAPAPPQRMQFRPIKQAPTLPSQGNFPEPSIKSTPPAAPAAGFAAPGGWRAERPPSSST